MSVKEVIPFCKSGDLASLKKLFAENPKIALLINKNDEHDFNPLLTAIHYYQNHIVAFFLMQAGTDLMTIHNKFKSSALHVCVYRKNLNALLMVLDWCVRHKNLKSLLNKPDVWGKTPLHQAVYHDFFLGAQSLLVYFPNINVKDINSKLPEDYCVYNKPDWFFLLKAYRTHFDRLNFNV